jgi:hypothetical protein
LVDHGERADPATRALAELLIDLEEARLLTLSTSRTR